MGEDLHIGGDPALVAVGILVWLEEHDLAVIDGHLQRAQLTVDATALGKLLDAALVDVDLGFVVIYTGRGGVVALELGPSDERGCTNVAQLGGDRQLRRGVGKAGPAVRLVGLHVQDCVVELAVLEVVSDFEGKICPVAIFN